MTPPDTTDANWRRTARRRPARSRTASRRSDRDRIDWHRRDVLRAAGSGAVVGLLGAGTAGVASADGASWGDGVNLQPSYFCDGDQDLGYDLMDQYPDIETVRIEIEPFSFGEVNTTVEDAKRWIDEANDHGYQVIATYHHYPDNGSADAGALQNAADFWVEHYGTLSADSSFVVNLMNEWGNHDVSASEYASAYDEAISTVRSGTSYDGPIVCDAPGWGQGTYRLADAVEGIGEDDLVLSSHVYPSAYSATQGRNMEPQDLDVLDETGYPCMIGEFGNYADSTGADWSAIVAHAKELGWPVIGWAWNGDGSDQQMNMADPYWGDDCSADSYTTSSYFDVVYSRLGDDGGNGADSTAPSAPSNLTVTSTTGSSVTVDWDASTDTGGSGLSQYVVTVDGSQAATVAAGTTQTTVSGLSAGTSYSVGVSAVDGAGNESTAATVTATTDDDGDGNGDTGDDPVATIDPSTTAAGVGDLVQFWLVDETRGSTWITGAEWVLGNGEADAGWYADVRYDSAGTYTVSLTATDSDDTATTDEVSVTIA